MPNNIFVQKEPCKQEMNYLDFKIAMQFLYVTVIQNEKGISEMFLYIHIYIACERKGIMILHTL